MPDNNTGRSFSPSLPENDRRELLGTALAGEQRSTLSVRTLNGYRTFPVVEAPQESLIYRVRNGRIRSELTELAARRGQTLDSLQENEGTAPVQEALHTLLLEKSKNPDGPIYQELAQQGVQTEPLLCTRSGVVLNGNRRLAAMRALLTSNTTQYAAFLTVQAAVLDDDVDGATEEFIEAALQLAPDLKLDYSWINRRLKLRDHLESFGLAEVLAAYRLESEEAVETELSQLKLATAYLDWIGHPGDFSYLADLEEEFTELDKRIKSVRPPYLSKVWRQCGFVLLSARNALSEDPSHYFPLTAPSPPAAMTWVPRTLAEERGLVEKQAQGENQRIDPKTSDKLAASLAAKEDVAATAGRIIALQLQLKENPLQAIGPAVVLNQLRVAQENITKIGSKGLTPDQLAEIRTRVEALQKLVATLSDAAG